MRASRVTVLVLMGLGLISCDRRDRAHESPGAREAGREAYKASQEVKHEAREAGRELHNAGKEFRQGWNEAKHTDRTDRTQRPDRNK